MLRRRSTVAVALATAASLLAGCGSTVAQQAQTVSAVPQDGTSAGALGPGLGDGAAAGPASGSAGAPAGPVGTPGGAPVPGAAALPADVAAPTGAGAPARAARPAAGAGPTSGAGAPTRAAAPAGRAVAATGPGWDRESVYIGIVTQKDVNTAAKAAGAKGIDGGDQEGEALAVAAELNRRGGVLGRKVKIVFKDIASADSSSDANSTGAAVCTYFAQDRRVIGVVNPASSIDVPSFRACMAKARIPLFSASVQAVDDEVAQRLAPFFYQSITPTWNRLAPVLLRRLQAVGWFGGWDPRTGSAAPGTAKVGVLVPDNDVGARVATTVASAFRSAGRPAPVFFRYASATDLSPAVLQFAGNGVTHVIVTDINLVLFQVAANSQGYRPRYGVTTYNGPQVFLETNSPPGQNRGAAGLGWSPSVDVSDANDPGPTGPGERDCLAMLAKGGQTFQGKRLAEAVAFAFCDGIRLLVAGPNASGGLLPDDVFDGVQQVAPSFSPSFGFGNGLGQGRFFIPGFGRDLSYSGDCSCFRYTSRANHSFLV